MGTTLKHFVISISVLLLMLAHAPSVLAQVNPEIANCEEIKDEATQTQIDFCTAHVGCKLVMGVQKTCAKVKTFIERLKEKVGDGTRSLFGTRRTVDATQVYGALEDMALEPPAYKKAALTEKWKQAAQSAEKNMKSMSKDSVTEEEELTGGLFGTKIETPNMARYAYKENGKTTTLAFIKDKSGEVTVSQFSLDEKYFSAGSGKFVSTSGEKALIMRSGANESSILHATKSGDTTEGRAENFKTNIGDGKIAYDLTQGQYTFADGTYFVGRASIGEKMNPIEGIQYTKDGQKSLEGIFRDGKLVEGIIYGADGKVTANITNLSDEKKAAQAKLEKAQAEAKRMALEQQQKELRAKQEAEAQQLRATQAEEAKLARMNPGELFAYADELSSQGNDAEARKTLKLLLSKFPNHPLATVAAQQLAGTQDSGSGSNTTSQSSPSTQNEPWDDFDKWPCKSEFAAYYDWAVNYKGSTKEFIQSLNYENKMLEFIGYGIGHAKRWVSDYRKTPYNDASNRLIFCGFRWVAGEFGMNPTTWPPLVDLWLFSINDLSKPSGAFDSGSREEQRLWTNTINQDRPSQISTKTEPCVTAQEGGALANLCPYPVSVAYCFSVPGGPDGDYDGTCARKDIQTTFLAQNQHTRVQTFSGVTSVSVYFLACKAPYVPYGVRFDGSVDNVRGKCGKMKDPSRVFRRRVLQRLNQ